MLLLLLLLLMLLLLMLSDVADAPAAIAAMRQPVFGFHPFTSLSVMLIMHNCRFAVVRMHQKRCGADYRHQ